MMKTTVLALLLCVPVFAQEKLADSHGAHSAGVEARGDHAMGFDHDKTTHHFLMRKDGGLIQITANDPKDTASRDAIRAHLPHIARMFSEGDFEAPMFIHDTRQPPGVSTLKRLKSEVRYKYEPIESGGRVRISTKNPEAAAAVHDFFRMQIRDHRTGDPLETPVP